MICHRDMTPWRLCHDRCPAGAEFIESFRRCRHFNETPVNPRKCIQILAKILYLLNSGESVGTTEATECFFAITKLFQVK